jgi:hypothetical protein
MPTWNIYKDHRDREIDRDTYPSVEELSDWLMDGIAEATDGCEVEPDGECIHEHRSWLLVCGLM